MNTLPLASVTRTSRPDTSTSWPAAPWRTWEPTHDSFLRQQKPGSIMAADPREPQAGAVAQADFRVGHMFGKHVISDVTRGATLSTHADRAAALAAAQALDGSRAIVGVFADDAGFAVSQLLLGERPLEDFTVNGDIGHGDTYALSGLRFVDDALVAFVRGTDRVER